MARPEWIEVGRISRAHGVHGEVRVVPSSDNPERFVPGSVMSCRPGRVGVAGAHRQERTRLTVEDVRGDESFPIVAFEEVPDRTAAEALRGYVLEVGACELPDLDDDEYYPFDLVGLTVKDGSGAVRGVVGDAVESPAHALLVIELAAQEDEEDYAPREVLVPFVSEAVPKVDVVHGYIVVESPFL